MTRSRASINCWVIITVLPSIRMGRYSINMEVTNAINAPAVISLLMTR